MSWENRYIYFLRKIHIYECQSSPIYLLTVLWSRLTAGFALKAATPPSSWLPTPPSSWSSPSSPLAPCSSSSPPPNLSSGFMRRQESSSSFKCRLWSDAHEWEALQNPNHNISKNKGWTKVEPEGDCPLCSCMRNFPLCWRTPGWFDLFNFHLSLK